MCTPLELVAGAVTTEETFTPSSLQNLCAVFLESRSKSLEQRVSLLLMLRDAYCEDNESIIKKLLFDLEDRFDVLLVRYAEELVKSILGEEGFARASSRRNARLEAEKKLSAYRRGSALEPKSVEGETIREDGSVPYSQLIAGVAWPSVVAPNRREQYLSEDEFLRVFCMSRSDFNQLDKIKRERLKKSKNLW